MNLRHSWKGFLKLSLVTIPVKAFPVAASGCEIHLHQLHVSCKSRIKYRKTCPVHGEVAQADIVSGYEHAKDQYVIVDPDELDKLRTEADKAIQIDAFLMAGCLDPIYATGKSYYLAPDGPVGQKSYAVFWKAMVEEKRQALAQVVMHGKEHLVWLRPLDGLLVMTQLSYEAQVTKPNALANEAPKEGIVAEELALLRQLMAARTPAKVDLAHYQDKYHEKLSALIEAKVAGKQIVALPNEQVKVLNLMEALKRSVAEAQDVQSKELPPTRRMPKKPVNGKSKRVGRAKKLAISA